MSPKSLNSSGAYSQAPNDADRTAFLFNLTSRILMRERLSSDSSDGQYQTWNVGSFGPTYGLGPDLYANGSLDACSAHQRSYGPCASGSGCTNVIGGTGFTALVAIRRRCK